MVNSTSVSVPPPSSLSLDEIVTSSLCMGCGLCQSIAGGPEKIELVITPEGRERPVVKSALDDEVKSLINTTCPGVNVSGILPDQLTSDDAEISIDPIWGMAKKMHISHATDPEIRYLGSSGGVLTALAIYLLESQTVDFILHVKGSETHPILSQPHLSFDKASVIQGSGSRYGPGAPLSNFMKVLEYGRPFAVVGKPCDITAIRNLGKHDKRVNELVIYCLSLVCGGMSNLSTFTDICNQFEVTESELGAFRYRGYGNPGLTSLTTKDGRSFAVTYQELWKDEATWGTQPRCKICPDAIGEVADIVAADCWPDANPKGEDEGFNAVIVRTEKGQQLFDEVIKANVLTITQDISFRDLDHFQPHQVRKKNAAWARFVGMKSAGLHTPKTERLRLEQLAQAQGWKKLLAEAKGAKDRVKSGGLGEPSPIDQ